MGVGGGPEADAAGDGLFPPLSQTGPRFGPILCMALPRSPLASADPLVRSPSPLPSRPPPAACCAVSPPPLRLPIAALPPRPLPGRLPPLNSRSVSVRAMAAPQAPVTKKVRDDSKPAWGRGRGGRKCGPHALMKHASVLPHGGMSVEGHEKCPWQITRAPNAPVLNKVRERGKHVSRASSSSWRISLGASSSSRTFSSVKNIRVIAYNVIAYKGGNIYCL